MPEMATGDDEAVPRGLPRPSSKATLPTRVRPAFVELDGVVPPMHYFAGGSARERDPLLWISPNGAEVRLPEVPALRFGGTDDSTVLARFIAPNEDVTLDMVVPDEWERYDADGREEAQPARAHVEGLAELLLEVLPLDLRALPPRVRRPLAAAERLRWRSA